MVGCRHATVQVYALEHAEDYERVINCSANVQLTYAKLVTHSYIVEAKAQISYVECEKFMIKGAHGSL